MSGSRPRSRAPTRRQVEVLRRLLDHALTHGRWPGIRELARLLGISPSAALCHVRSLAAKGYLEHQQGRYRLLGVQLVPTFTGAAGEHLRRLLQPPP
jgi:DNA-binding MarR family transcriptional regulator